MKRVSFLSLVMLFGLFVTVHGQSKLVSSKTHIKFFSTTPAEDIVANNYAAVSTITPENGRVVFSVPMQSFEFKKSMMQKHYNGEDYLDTKSFPKAKLKAVIDDISSVDFTKDGTYSVSVSGDLTLKGKTNALKESGTMVIKGNLLEVKSVFNITLSDYGVAFAEGKPSTNIAKNVEVTVVAEYTIE